MPITQSLPVEDRAALHPVKPQAGSARATAFGLRLDLHLETLESPAERRAFLADQLGRWRGEHARFIARLERGTAEVFPGQPDAFDYLLTVVEIEQRIAAMEDA